MHAVWSAIGTMLPSVSLSINLFATMCILTIRAGVGVESYKYRRVFLGGDFLCTSSDTFAVGCIGENDDGL